MDAVVKKIPAARPKLGVGPDVKRPERAEAEEAVRTLIAWAGDDPAREGLIDTPGRVVNAYREFFQGYEECPIEVLSRTFDDVGGYDDIVMLRDIDLYSHCEHHMVPFIGKAHVAYMPNGAVVGISKLARVVEIYARRLQTQETITAQIAYTIDSVLKPDGVLSITEDFVDPDYNWPGEAAHLLARAGFEVADRFGSFWLYTLNSRKAQ